MAGAAAARPCPRDGVRGRIAAMKLGLFLPVAGDPAQLRAMVATTATLAERTGVHSLWFAEHVALFDTHASRYPYSPDGSFPLTGEIGFVEPFVAIAFAAALTTRIRLGTGICLVPQRPPLYTAKQVADADVLSGGRLDFGVGIGWLREEFEALGVPFAGRAARCREYLAALRAYAEAGVDQVIYLVGLRGPDTVAAEIEALATELIPTSDRLGLPARRRA